MRSKLSNKIWGLLFIIFGIGIAGRVFDLWDFNLLFNGWWTLFIIIPSFTSMIRYGLKTSNILGIIIGVLLFLSCWDIIDSKVIGKLIAPLTLIVIGLKILSHSLYSNRAYRITSNLSNNRMLDFSEVFSSKKIVYSETFHGANINTIFGGFELDLRHSSIEEDTVIDCCTIFGGADILVPPNVNVNISSVPIFGGISDKSIGNMDPNSPVLYINAFCLFGGVDIKWQILKE